MSYRRLLAARSARHAVRTARGLCGGVAFALLSAGCANRGMSPPDEATSGQGGSTLPTGTGGSTGRGGSGGAAGGNDAGGGAGSGAVTADAGLDRGGGSPEAGGGSDAATSGGAGSGGTGGGGAGGGGAGGGGVGGAADAGSPDLAGSGGAGGNGGASGTGGGPGGNAGSGGSAGRGGGSGGSAGRGGAGGGSGGSAGSGGTGGAGGCPARTSYTQADHMILDVTWGGGGTENGSGQIHIWAKIGFSAGSNTLSAIGQTCGRVLPPATLTLSLGMILIEIPDQTWTLPSMPRFMFSATQSGWNVGSTLSYGYTALVGISPTDPTANTANPWPASYTDIASVDADGDGSPGLTAVPRNGNGFVQPPTGNLINRVDRLYLALRNTMLIMSTRSGCDTASGTATFSHFDNHVVGCHVSGGQNCSATDIALVDLNRTAYQVTSATIQSKIVADAATCADVRAALP